MANEILTDMEFLERYGVEPTDEQLEAFIDRVDALVCGGKVSLSTARRVAFDEYIRGRNERVKM